MMSYSGIYFYCGHGVKKLSITTRGVIGMAKSETVYHEAWNNFQVILLLIFMVTGIYFLKDLLLFIVPKILLQVRSKTKLALLFCGMGAFLSAFLDALSVTAVLIAVAVGFSKCLTEWRREKAFRTIMIIRRILMWAPSIARFQLSFGDFQEISSFIVHSGRPWEVSAP